MAYDVKCPSCGLLHTLHESDLGSQLACAQCDTEFVFDEPLKQRRAEAKEDRTREKERNREAARVSAAKAEKKADKDRQRKAWVVAETLRDKRASEQADIGAEKQTETRQQPKYIILGVVSWCCYLCALFVTIVLFNVIVQYSLSASVVADTNMSPESLLIPALLTSVLLTHAAAIFFLIVIGAVVAAFRDMVINSWRAQ